MLSKFILLILGLLEMMVASLIFMFDVIAPTLTLFVGVISKRRKFF